MRHRLIAYTMSAITAALACGNSLATDGGDATPPPISVDEMSGVWEAIAMRSTSTLVIHLDFNPYKSSFLYMKVIGSPVYELFRMLSCDSSDDGKVRLRFRGVYPAEISGEDLLLEGVPRSGSTPVFSAHWSLGTNTQPNVVFLKGEWLRDITHASIEAESAIRAQPH